MKHAAAPSLSFIPRFLSVLLLAFAAFAAHADDYLDVNTLLRQGKAAEALAKADAYIASKPRDPQMRFLRGVILTEQGKQAEAVAAFTQLTQDFPELPEPYNNLAALYASQSQFDKARAALEMAIKLNPNYATAHENLGDVYARLAGQSYGRAQQLEASNTSIPPKLALIRQLFSAPGSASLPPAPAEARKPVRR
jgi:Flp pilus assembly protein TadD